MLVPIKKAGLRIDIPGATCYNESKHLHGGGTFG